MAQFLRPDSNVTQTSFTGGFAEIDEATASDADFAYTPDASSGTLEVGLSNPTGTPGAGVTTVRYRLGKTNDGVLDQGGSNSPTCTVSMVQGTNVLVSDTLRTVSALTDYSWTPDTSGVTDWTDLRLRFVAGSSGGNPTNRRGLGVIWAEIEAPDASAGTIYNDSLTEAATAAVSDAAGLVIGVSLSEAATGGEVLAAAQILVSGYSEATIAAESLAAGLTIAATISDDITAADSMAGGLFLSATISEDLTGVDTLSAGLTIEVDFAEDATAADADSTIATLPNALAESVTAAESLADEHVISGGDPQTYDGSIAESLTAGAAFAAALQIVASVTENATLVDGAAVAATHAPALTESLSLAEGFSAMAVFASMLSEAVSTSAGMNADGGEAPVKFPLAGIPVPRPLAVAFPPRPLAGVKQTYPLGV